MNAYTRTAATLADLLGEAELVTITATSQAAAKMIGMATRITARRAGLDIRWSVYRLSEPQEREAWALLCRRAKP